MFRNLYNTTSKNPILLDHFTEVGVAIDWVSNLCIVGLAGYTIDNHRFVQVMREYPNLIEARHFINKLAKIHNLNVKYYHEGLIH